ncbi:MAG: hypothetical protein NTW25_03755 [Candidatus Kapabacteria bacterium]|nr:hypothetical protein [Candidatus Kapabacteria bacterium]
MRKYWQVSSGSKQRDFSDIFIKYGVFATNDDTKTTKYKSLLKEMKEDDILILKKGLNTVIAIGKIKSKKVEEESCYFNFDGWKLNYFKKVDWYLPFNGREKFSDRILNQGTISQCHNHEVITFADKTLKCVTKNIVEFEIQKVSEISDEKIIETLINNGMKVQQAEIFTSTMLGVRRLAKYYTTKFEWKEINENQVKCFLVIPLLLALGWSEQQIILEYKLTRQKADIVCLDKPIHLNNHNIKLLIEVKKLSEGLDFAIDQAIDYAKSFNEINENKINTLVLTNGFCYQIYLVNNKNEYVKNSYINILELLEKYPSTPESKGALEAIIKLLRI